MDARSPAASPRSGHVLHRFANPGQFLRLSGRLLPWLYWPGVLLTVGALVFLSALAAWLGRALRQKRRNWTEIRA